eukprot:m.67234 g.67234  ORF g.67234 m.67234 type:complete len:156 (+) comp7666_c0_seq4:122-589(+)
MASTAALESSPLVPEPAADLEDTVPSHLARLTLTATCHDYAVMDSYMEFARRAGSNLNLDIGGVVRLPTKITRYTVLKSPHVSKKHRVQYETRVHKRLLQIRNVTGQTAQVYLEYVKDRMPEGVSLRIAQVGICSSCVNLKPYNQSTTGVPGVGS